MSNNYEDIKVEVQIDNMDDFMKIRPSVKQLKEKYRASVDKWARITNGNSNNKYGERLEKATNEMNKLRQQLINSGCTSTI